MVRPDKQVILREIDDSRRHIAELEHSINEMAEASQNVIDESRVLIARTAKQLQRR